MELQILISANQDIKKNMTNTSFSIFNFSNKIAWILTFAITLAFSIFIIFGPEIHSEIEDAASYSTKFLYLCYIFFMLGSLIIPIKKGASINLVVFSIGAIATLLKILLGLYNVAFHNQSLTGSLAIVVLFFIMGFFYYKKLKFRDGFTQ